MTTVEKKPAFRPLVSVVVNNYNYGRFLHSAIGSALRQTYDNFEVIVVDDGSTDHSREIIASYGDRIIPILTENNGQANAVNVSALQARGAYLAFLDSDDFWEPDKLKVMVALAEQRPKAGLLYHRYIDTDLAGNAINPPAPGPLINGHFAQRYHRGGGSYWHPIMSTLMLSRALIDKVVPIQTYPNREGADSILTDCGLLLGEVASAPQTLTYRRMHGMNQYAAGRETPNRSAETRRGDMRRIEWRILCVRQILARHGIAFGLDLRDNEWYQFNSYMLGEAGWLPMALSTLRNREQSMRGRLHRLRWISGLKRSGVH